MDQDFSTMAGLSAPMLPTDDLSRAWWDLNDSGNARRFKCRHGERFLYVRSQGWFAYDGKAWTRDGAEDRALLAARETGTSIKAEAAALFEAATRDDARAKALNARALRVGHWAEISGSITRAKGMLSFAAAELSCGLDEFDREPLALNVQNGTLRFQTVEGKWQVRLDPHDPADRISRVAAFAYNPQASHPRWTAHLERMIPDFWERRYLLRSLGYVATGLTSEQVFLMWQGRGGDGKSVTANTVRRVLGGYGSTADVKTFLEEKGGRSAAAASPDLARLAGATRLVSVSEPPRGARLNEGMIKQFTGGAPMTARHLNKDPFEFNPRFKLVLECNALPGIGGSDDGIWRRVQILPWRVQLKKDEMDTELEGKLVEEGEGVLSTIVDGALSYLMGGLRPPKGINAAHADYKRSSNAFRDWLDAFTVFDADHICLLDLLYSNYRSEQEAQGLEPISKKAFGLALSDLQVLNAQRQGGTGKHRRQGLRLLTDFERHERAEQLAAVTDDPSLTESPCASHLTARSEERTEAGEEPWQS